MNSARADEQDGNGLVTDRLLDGRLLLRQPARGHRAGSDAVLLAAALPALGSGPLADLGAGVGAIGLAAALRQEALEVVLVERDPEMARLAAGNIGLNGLDGRVTVSVCDVTASIAGMAEAGLAPGRFACVAMNPPFFPPGTGRPSPAAQRARAHVADTPLSDWLRAARRLLRPGGDVAIIHRAEALGDILAGLASGFGAVSILPIHPDMARPAIRVIVRARLNSRKPAQVLPAFVLNEPDGRFTPDSEAVHRGRLSLAAGDHRQTRRVTTTQS